MGAERRLLERLNAAHHQFEWNILFDGAERDHSHPGLEFKLVWEIMADAFREDGDAVPRWSLTQCLTSKHNKI